MFSTFNEATKYLESLIRSRKSTPLERKLEKTAYLLKLCGNPQDNLKLVQIGGTSGKGSVAYFLSEILTTQGYKVGLHVSPHLQTITERAQIDGQLMPKEKFIDYVAGFKPLINRVEKDLKPLKINYFETLVAIALKYFADEKVDIAIIEVGLGGSFDSTNVLKPLMSVITNVGLDHTEILGKTVQKIAADKAGIIKQDSLVLTGARQPSVQKIISGKAKSNKSRVLFLRKDFNYKIKTTSLNGSVFDFGCGNRVYRDLRTSVPGKFQIENASLALAAACLLSQFGFEVNRGKISQALRKVKIPGRFEVVQENPLVILDGAHNPGEIKIFVSSLVHVLPRQKFIFVVVAKKDQDERKILGPLVPHAKTVVITDFKQTGDSNKQFSSSAAKIIRRLKGRDFSGEVIVEKQSWKALAKAKKIADHNDTIVVTGSLYLVGEIRNLFYPQ